MRIIITAIFLALTPALAAAQAQTDLPPETVVAVIDGVDVRLSEVTAVALTLDGKRLFSLNQQLHTVRERALNNLIGERLLARAAKDAGMTVDEYVDALPVEPIDDKDIELMLADALQRNAAIDPDKLRELIREHLRDQKRQDARRAHVEQLKLDHKKAGTPIVMRLQPPRLKVDVTPDDPTKGRGPVEIIEFSDFECPYCQKAQPMIRELLAKYEGKVRLVWKDFPLPNHQHAVAAAIAARCAGEQGRFWQYHDVLFDNQRALSPTDLRRHARTAGVDVNKFDACIQSGKHREAIGQVLDNTSEHLVEVTPTFLINGRVVQGAVPLYEMAAIVEQELGN
jgi:protein-disulfide isomerase